MRIARQKHPEWDLERSKPPIVGKKLENLLKNYTKQFLRLSQSLLIEAIFRLAHKSLVNPLMTITINFRSFLRKILVFLQMLILFR